MGSFVETKKEFKKLNEVNDAEERIKTEKNAFEIWLPMVFMRDPDKIKYGELINDFDIQYAIKNDKYPKTLQEAVDIRHKVKYKLQNNNDKSNKQKQNKN